LRATLAERKLSLIASIPNDSWGWRSLRQTEARKALRDLLDAIEEEDGHTQGD